MGEILEEFISGFCRTSNETRTICCEYEQGDDGSVTLRLPNHVVLESI